MNRIYKVIFNRNRNLVQVVPEYAHSNGKKVSASRHSKARGLARVLLSFLAAMMIASPGYAADGDGTDTTTTTTTYISDTNSTDENVKALDTQVAKNAADISTNKTNIATNTSDIATNKESIASNKTAIDTNTKSIETNTTNIATNTKNIASNKTAIDANTKNIETNTTNIATNTKNIASNKTSIDANTKNIETNTTNIATNTKNIASNKTSIDANTKNIETNTANIATNTKNIATNTSDITSLKDLSNITTAGQKVITGLSTKVKAGDRVTVATDTDDTTGQLTYTISANNNGAISIGDTNLVSGGTMYTELRPTGGTYVLAGNTTAANLLALDTNLVNVVNALGLDVNDTTKSYTSKLNKYFKVNPKITTSTDGTTTTTTYAPDAAANGTNAVAIGPSAQAGESTTDAATGTTTVTGGTSSTAVGDSAKANGNQAVALGYNASVLNPSSGTSTGSTAIGSSATVDSASNAMALGTNATINETATSGLAIGNGATTGAAEYTKTVNDTTSVTVAAAGGVNSVAIGTSANAAGNTSIAMGDGASVTNDTDGNYQAVVNSDDIAIGTSAKTAASDSSTAIGKSASVSQSTDAVAIGSSASASTSNDALVLGKGAKAASAADSIAMGTSAAANSADVVTIGSSTSATGANSVVIGKSATTTSEGGNAIGSGSTASGYSTAIGQSATANNYYAVAIGNNATANADKSISLGYKAGVGTTEGKGEAQNAGSLIAIGTSAGNNVSGMQNVAIGEEAGSNVKSNYNVAIGTQAGYGINYSSDTLAQNGYNISIGNKANYQSASGNIMYSTALGNEANATNYAIAIGDLAKANGTNSLALGYTAQAADADSISLGRNASSAGGNVAIGAGSTAPATSTLGTVKDDGYVYKATTTTDTSGTSTTTYTQYKSAFTYKPLAANSTYISVGDTSGTTTLTRRISNVADGVFDSDAATIGQLNSLNELLQATDTKVGLTKDYFEQKFTDLNTNIDSVKPHYFAISSSSETLTDNYNNTGATANMADAMAIGPNANATNKKTLAIGNNVYATGLRSIAIGTADNPTTDSAGTKTTHNTSAEGENSIALGTSTTAQADNSIAIGTRAQTYTTDSTSTTGVQSVAIGYSASTAGNTSVAVGNNATVKYASGTAVGTDSLADGTNAVAIGEGSKAYSDNSMAIGQSNSITGKNTYGLGSSNKVNGAWSAVTTSGVSGYNNSVTAVSDANTMNEISGIYITGNNNKLTQNVVNNKVSDITVTGSDNNIDAGAGGTSSHPNTLSQLSIVGFNNTVLGKSSDNSLDNSITGVTILGYNNTVDANTDTNKDFSNTQILGNNVKVGLGNSVYLGNNAAYVGQVTADSDAITAAKTAADTAAEASDEYAAATTDAAKAQIKAQYEAKYLYKLNVQAMEKSGTTAGTQSYSTDETYGDGTSYTYAGSTPAGVVTVGKVGSERRIQNVAAGLVSATSTDAVNGSQLYALTRQLRFGGDNSTFGATSDADTNVIARGSAQTLAITGGGPGVNTTNTNGVTTTTVDSTKLTDKNISVIADTDANALNVKLASNLTSLNTAQLGSGSGTSYQETIKLDGTGKNGGSIALKDADGNLKNTVDTTGMTLANGAKFTSNGISAGSQQINDVKAGTVDTDAVNYGQLKNARTLLKQGTNTTLTDSVNGDQHTYTVNVDNLAVKANGTDQASVTLANGLNFKNGTNTTAAVASDGTVTINATHNKLASVTAKAATATSDDANLTLQDADGNKVTSTGLKNTYTTISNNGTDHTVTFARNDGVSNTLSLGDLNGASKDDLTTSVNTLNSTIKTEAAKATSTVIEGANVASVTDDTTSTDGHHIYKVNVDDLAVKVNNTQKAVQLKTGLAFSNGTNTTATMNDKGIITYDISDATIKTKAKDAINLTAGTNVTVDTVTSADGTTKTFTVSATHNKLASAEAKAGDQDNVTLTLKDADGNTLTSTGLKNTYSTGGSVTYAASGEGTATVTRNDGNTYTITGLKDTKVVSGKADYIGSTGTATLTMNDGTKATITGLQNDYVTSAKVVSTGENKNHVTLTRLGGDKVDVNLNPILDNYSLSDYRLVGNGDTQDKAYTVGSDGTVTLNVVDSKNAANKKTIQITGLASQSGVNASRTTVKSSNGSIAVTDNTSNSNTHTYDIQVDYSKIPSNLKVQYSGDTGTGSNTMDTATAFNGTDGQIVTKAENGKVTFNLAKNVTGIDSVTTGNAKLDTNGLTIQENGTDKVAITASKVDMGGNVVSNIGGAVNDNDAATLGQVKKARTVVAAGSNVSSVDVKDANDDSNQKTYTVNVENLSVKANNETAKSVSLGTGLTFNNGTNTTAVVDDKGITYNLNDNISLTSVQTGATKMDNTGITNGSMSLSATGLTIGNGAKFTSSGISAGNQQIKDVAEGINETDAVNVKQLNALTSKVDSASWTIEDADHTDNAQTVKNGDTVALKAGDNLLLSQDGKKFTYSLNKVVTGMTSVTAVDDKQNTAVLNGEGLKVSDKDGNSLTQHATEVRLHDANKAADDTTTDVVLNKQGLQNGGHTITGVADGKVVAGSQEAVNGGQLYALQQKVGSGWKITGNNTASTTSIGADKTVSFVDGKNSTVTVSGSDSGATVKVDVDTAALAVKDSKAVATGSGVADASEVAEAINNAAWTVEKAGSEAQAQQVKAGTTVTFGNDENLTLAQNGTAFTYGLASNVNISTIRLGGTKGADGVWTGGIYIGKQVGGGANPNDGNYITGLDNTSWDLSKVVDDRAATEGQLKAAINQVTIASQSGGFGLRDESGNTVTQMLGQTVSVVGDTEYEADGKTVKQQGNITTEADSTNVGGIKVKLNKNLDLTDQGSVTIGQSSVTSGKVVLGSDADTTKKITLDSSKGTATVGGVTINGTKKTVTGLANTTWNGTAVSGRAATEDQLAAAISQATTTAQDNELHVKGGSYDIQTTTDAKGQKQNSVTLSVVDGKGEQKDTVVINDVAKASDVGDTDNLAGDIRNKNGTTSVVDAVNNLNDKVGNNQYLDVVGKEISNGDSSTTAIGKLNNRMNDIYSKATQHNTVSKADDNVTIATTTNADGGTNYQIGLNKEKLDLGNVTIKGNDGSITAKSVTADTFTSGNTVVNNDGVKIGDKAALTSDTLKVNGKTYVSGDGINANSQKITNVADGTADGDAVNVKQVNAMAARQDAAINQNARAINNLGREVDKLDSRIDRVGAGAAALAALNPGQYDPNDKVDFSAGYGNYRGASAAAVGMYYHPDERTIMSLGVAMGGGENMVNAGVTWKLGRRTPVRPQAVPVAGAVSAAPAIPVKTAAPVTAQPVVQQTVARPVVSQPAVIQQEVARPAVTSLQNAAATNAQLMDLLARQTAILERLSEQKAAPAAAPVAKGDDLFPDVPENHWAYSFVSKLARAGVLKGTPEAQAATNPLLTRNDFAQILYAALKNGATTNPALNQDGSLNKLASEFKAELKNVKK